MAQIKLFASIIFSLVFFIAASHDAAPSPGTDKNQHKRFAQHIGSPRRGAQRTYSPSEITKVVFLGTGTPNPDPQHSGNSVAVVVNDTPYIIDFGPGLIRKAAALSPSYGGKIRGLETENIKRAFLTHLHSDHTTGYPDLILTPWVMGRDEPLEVYGPEGIKNMTKHILEAYKEDIRIRLYGL